MYETKKGNHMPAKMFDPNFDYKCKRKCASSFIEKDLPQFFKSFWKLADFSKQNIFYCWDIF